MEQAELQKRLKALPAKPGIYVFKDRYQNILYVGKAVSLRNRVRSYFRPRGLTPKVAKMVPQIADFEYTVTASELEALILECNLIKEHRPKYNVQMKDDKNYPYLRISFDEEWPRVYITRRFARDGARYFGPYTDSRSVRRTLEVLKKIFPYRSCHKEISGTETRPCLNYHIKRCLGPCIGAVDREDYLAVLKQVALFLEGKQEEVLKELRRKMEEAAELWEFERAAALRDQIQAIERVAERQKIISTAMKDEDVIAFARSNGEACVQVFFIRRGKLIGREHFILENTQDEDPREIMTSFVMQFYDNAPYVPERLLLQSEVDEATIIQSWLRGKRGDKVTLQVPRKGEKKQLVDMVAENAAEVLEQMRIRWLADAGKTGIALRELAEHLTLPNPPHRIECYDISNLQGTSAVGSMVVFESGQPKNGDYRRFKIKGGEQPNDYAMLQEVLRRRFKRGSRSSEKDDSWTIMPDLLIVDGGKGQLNAALEVMRELDVEGVPVAALAKEREEIFLPEMSEPVLLPRTSQSLYLVQRIRDEAHRFAVTYHQSVRQKRAFTSALDEVPGIGPKRKAALLKHFGTVKKIREAPLEEIAAVPGMTRRLAQVVKDHL